MANQPSQVDFLFETDAGRFVEVLAGSTVWPGRFASQNAGSSNPSIYYQVGGSGVNGQFFDALEVAGTIDDVNRRLIEAYDEYFGPGAYLADSANPRRDRLTSLWIPFNAAQDAPTSNVAGMMYSVGPVLGVAGITDRGQYAKIYEDAVVALAAAAPPVTGLRIVMLSCGVYARSVADKNRLFLDAAECILDGILAGARKSPHGSLQTVLINHRIDETGKSAERDAFTAVASARGLPNSTASGFSIST